MNWVLIAVLAVLLVNILIGMRKGLIKMIFSVISIAVAVVLTSILVPKVSGILKKNTDWDEKLEQRTEMFLEQHGALKHGSSINVNEIPLPESVRNKVSENTESYIDKGCEIYNEYVVRVVSDIVFRTLVYVGLFIIFMIIIAIISTILNVVSRLPVLRQINRVAGGLMGALTGLLLVWIAFMFVTIFSSSSAMIPVFEQIERNALLSFLYDKNILMKFVLALF